MDVRLADWVAAREKCGLFGVYAPERTVAKLTFYGLFALQHRGQESAGIAVATSDTVTAIRRMGLVTQGFNEEDIQVLKGKAAIGHTRYSTTGSSVLKNAQPFVFDSDPKRPFAIAHNGNLVNTPELSDELKAAGVELKSTSDTWVFGKLLELELRDHDMVTALQRLLPRVKGAYCFVILTTEAVYAVRDPYGIRPLSLGVLESSGLDGAERYVCASESCAFGLVGATFLREVPPGHIVRIGEEGTEDFRIPAEGESKFCMFELFYFLRPDSEVMGQTAYSVRVRMGRQLARESPADADLVIPIPDSGTPAAIGFAQESGLPLEHGLIKNRYVYRTFIEPEQELREKGVRLKFSPMPEVIGGKRIVVIDDSIVRGSTSNQLVRMLREAGAREVHLRISSPPIRHPCFYGFDFGTYEELIAAGADLEEIERVVGADSLRYLSLEGIVKATGHAREEFCLACFTGNYPIPIPGQLSLSKFMLERTADNGQGAPVATGGKEQE